MNNTDTSRIYEEYIREKSIRTVAKKLGISKSYVKYIISEICGDLRGTLCATYLLLKKRKYLSTLDIKKTLNVTSPQALNIMKKLIDKRKDVILIRFSRDLWKRKPREPLTYIVIRDYLDEFLDKNRFSVDYILYKQ